ncbi:flavin monoamine oxidase family protein [Nocardioides sp. NPDC126508]
MNTSEGLTATDVVVIGAGLSGLVAARNLRKAGLDVHVVEAADRVGGRVRSATVGGAHVDLGGTFVGPTQDRMIALADEVGVRRFPTYVEGGNLMYWSGARRSYRGTLPNLGPLALADAGRIQTTLDRMSRKVPPGRPWDAPKAQEWDAQSLGSWMRGHRAAASTYEMFAIASRATWGCEPDELSLLHALNYISMAGGMDPLLDTAGGAQDEHFVEGSHEVAARVAAELGEDRVHLSRPALSVDQSGEIAHVRTPDLEFLARRVIIAVPVWMRQRIKITPSLGPDSIALGQRWPGGVLSKAYAVYDRPFWRDLGLSGQAVSDRGPAVITFDASPEDGSHGVLLGFIGGKQGRLWDLLPEEERRLRALSGFAELFGEQARHPLDYLDQRWVTEEWVGGGPCAAPGPGHVLPYARLLAKPQHLIHWAGTETADRWSGFMDGAVRAGERAATEVIDAVANAAVATAAVTTAEALAPALAEIKS